MDGLTDGLADCLAREWFVLRSKPKQERLAGSLLERAGIEVFVPLVRSARRSRMHTRTHAYPVHSTPSHAQLVQSQPVQSQPVQTVHLEPFFPSYLFAKLDPLRGELRLANYTTGVLHVVGFGDSPTPVPDPIIEEIRQRLASGQVSLHSQLPHFAQGERVVISEGPFDEVEAIFDRELSPSGRVRVLIQMLERLCPVDLEIESLRPRAPAKALSLARAAR